MSDFINGYIEWRGRDTLLKSQYGILDKESGEHLVPVVHPENYFDPNDMDIISSVPNVIPSFPEKDIPLKPKIHFGTSQALTNDDIEFTGDTATIRVNGRFETFKGTKVTEAFVMFNFDGHNSFPFLPEADGSFEYETTIPLEYWEAENKLIVFARAVDPNDQDGTFGPWAVAELPIAIDVIPHLPKLEVKKFLNANFIDSMVYEFAPNFPRMDVQGRCTGFIRGDHIKRVWAVMDNDSEYECTLTHGIDENGYAYADWFVSIPAFEVEKLGNTVQKMTINAISENNGNASTAVHKDCQYYRK